MEKEVETTQKTTQKRILEVLRSDPYATRKEIAVLLGDISENGVKYHLDILRNEGKIRRVGGKKGGYWEIIENERSK